MKLILRRQLKPPIADWPEGSVVPYCITVRRCLRNQVCEHGPNECAGVHPHYIAMHANKVPIPKGTFPGDEFWF